MEERQTKVTVSIEQDEKTNTMEQFYKILNLVFKFDLWDNPNGGTYSLLEVAYLKLTKDDGTPLTENAHCCETSFTGISYYVWFLFWSCSSVDFYAGLCDQFIEAGEKVS